MTGSTDRLTPAARAQLGRLPDFFIVGHPKSGTTALYEMLKRHPQIFMPDLKEPRYFAADLRSRFQPRGSDVFPETLEDYLALFAEAAPEQLVGEASPSYLRSRTAAAAIAAAQPGARIIAILREPASFLRSMHLEMVQNRVEGEKDLRRALAREALAPAAADMPGAGQPPPLRYSDRIRYVEQLRRYHEAFSPEQVLVLIYDDFRSENEATVRRVLRFLGVDDRRPIELVEANPSVSIRSLRADDAVRALYAGRTPVARVARTAITAVTPRRLRSGLAQAVRRRLVYGPPPAPDSELMSELRRRFAPEVAALGEYLGRDLVALWGYDQLD